MRSRLVSPRSEKKTLSGLEMTTSCPSSSIVISSWPDAVTVEVCPTQRSRTGGCAMQAWVVGEPGPIDGDPLRLVERPTPEPGPNEIRVRLSVCGVCRTDLHLAEGDLPLHHAAVVPGHEAVGVVDALGAGASRFGVGDRVGIAWLRWTCGSCRFCTRGDENLCVAPLFTGW